MSKGLEENSICLAGGLFNTEPENKSLIEFKIAIIGCGAACVATLYELHAELNLELKVKLKISIFEKNTSFGSGFAYQCDNDELLMNMVSSTTSIFADQETDFWEWMLEKGHHIGINQVISKSGVAPDSYISRQFFGLYLNSRLEDAILALEKMGVEIDLINLEVIEIGMLGSNDLCVRTIQQDLRRFNCVILCIGNIPPEDTFNLSGKSHYINNPYPIDRYVRLINKDESIGIIGGQLTAADIAVVLATQGHQGQINFFTRELNFPLLRCRINQCDLTYLNAENLQVLIKNNKEGISIRQILRLARKDFASTGIRWNKFFKSSNISYAAWIQQLLEQGSIFSHWQSLAIKTDDVIGDYWHALKGCEKDLFMQKYHRLWASKRVPLPMHTALKLHSLFRLGILKHYPYLCKIDSPLRNQFIAFLSKTEGSDTPAQIHCDWVINASGPSRDISNSGSSLLIRNLLESGMILKDPNGGIMLDYKTARIKSSGHQGLRQFYAVGHLTSGTYYFVSSLDMVSLRAKVIAQDLARFLNVNFQNQVRINQSTQEDMYAS